MTLFELNKAIEEFELIIDEETGEVLNFDELDALKLAKEDKIESVCLWVKNLDAEAEAIKAEEKALEARRKSKENLAERLRGYISYALKGETFETPKVAVSYRKSTSVVIPDETVISDEYCDMRIVRKPNKTIIKNALKEGRAVHGAELVEKNNLQIK